VSPADRVSRRAVLAAVATGAATGDERWSVAEESLPDIGGDPVVAGDTVYFARGGQNRAYGFAAATGERVETSATTLESVAFGPDALYGTGFRRVSRFE